jgi:hypothetical protein
MLHALLRLGFTTISPSQAENDYDTRGSSFSDDCRNDEMQSVALRCPAPHSPRDLMQVTAGEGVREECLKGRLNRTGVFALVRGQVSPGDERIESRVGHANLMPLKFVVAVPRATRRRSGRTSCWFHKRPPQSVAVDDRAAFLRSLPLLISGANWSQACSIFR